MKVFKEEQKFTKPWIIILILISSIIPAVVIYSMYYSNPESFSSWELLLSLSVTLLAPLVIFIFKLNTRIDEVGIHYKFFPFHFKYKTIKWEELSKAYVRQYDAISEYGGWGLKGGLFWKKSNGIAINVSGDLGIQLELKNTKKILIGTAEKIKAEQVLNEFKTKITS